MRWLVALVPALVLVVGACGDDDLRVGSEASSTTESPGSTTTEAPSAPEVPAVGLVLASEAGVERASADGRSTMISPAPAATAFGVDDLVVFQGGIFGDHYPPGAEGPIRVWSAGAVRGLPLDPGATRVALLDAGRSGGAPVALVAEWFVGAGPEDTFEHLVLIDLVDDTRTTLVRRPSWESGHISARLLPDGDAIGIFGSVILARWSPGSAEASWTVELGFDIHVDLAVLDGAITAVRPSFDEARGLTPVLTLTTHEAATGEPGAPRALDVIDPDGTIDTGLFCDEWLSSSLLACSRAGGPPLAVSTIDGAVIELTGHPGARATVIRTG